MFDSRPTWGDMLAMFILVLDLEGAAILPRWAAVAMIVFLSLRCTVGVVREVWDDIKSPEEHKQ